METIYEYKVVWIGTAEVNHRLKGERANDSIRVRAALVQSPKRGTDKVLVEWEGKWFRESAASFSREYEDSETGELIEKTAPEISKRIDAVLKEGR